MRLLAERPIIGYFDFDKQSYRKSNVFKEKNARHLYY
jgi:hypothetical protein